MSKYIPKIKIVNLIDDRLFCLCDDCNCILSINLKNFKVEYVGKLEGEYSFQLALSCCSTIYKSNILYSPYYSRGIHFFDTNKMKDCIINVPFEIDMAKCKYVGLLQEEAKYYAVPCVGEKILEIDMNEKRVTRTIDIYNILKKKGIMFNRNAFSASNGYRYKDKFYISMENIPFVVALDFKNDNYEAFKLAGLDNGSCGIAGISNLLYIYNKDHYIITYNIDEKEVVNKVKVPISEYGDRFFYIAAVSGNDIYFLQRRQSIAIKYNVVTYDIEFINFNHRLVDAQNENEYKFIEFIEKNKILLISDTMRMSIADFGSNKYEHIQLEYSINELKYNVMQNIYFQSENIEYSELALPCFIRYEGNGNMYKEKSSVGAKIYSVI